MKYNTFVEAKGDLAFQLSFLAKAVSDDETRYFMQYIHVEPSDKGEGLLGVATDGRRLHIVDQLNGFGEALGITPGFWRVLKDRSTVWIARLADLETEKIVYPSWRKVMPRGEPPYTTTFSGFDISGPESNPRGLARLLRDFPDTTAINLRYLKDLGTSLKWKVEWYGSGEALKFTEGNRTSVIMPMHIG